MDLVKKSLEFLGREIFYRDYYIDKIREYLELDIILVVQWQRRVGKSYVILWYLKKLGITQDRIFYINKELDERSEINEVKDLIEIFEIYIKQNKNIEYIVIDEIQDIKNWEKFIRARFSEKKYKIIISGSNSSLLSSELATFLTWRYIWLDIYPFDYTEFLDYKEEKSSKELFNEYVTYWWLPEILCVDNKDLKSNYIKTTLNSIIFKDIVARFNIKDVKLLEKILFFIYDNLGNLLSIRNIYNYLIEIWYKTISLSTVSNYIKYLQIPYIINDVKRYNIKWKEVLKQIDKYYFTDIWIRNSYWFIFSQDVSKVLENLVYNHLKKNWYEVFVWVLWEKEIDFIAIKNLEKIYLQVCYLFTSDEVVKREFNNLLSINDSYPKYVISMDETFGQTYEWIKNVNIIDFLMQKI